MALPEKHLGHKRELASSSSVLSSDSADSTRYLVTSRSSPSQTAASTRPHSVDRSSSQATSISLTSSSRSIGQADTPSTSSLPGDTFSTSSTLTSQAASSAPFEQVLESEPPSLTPRHTPTHTAAADLSSSTTESKLRLRKTAGSNTPSDSRNDQTDSPLPAHSQHNMFGSTPNASYLPLNSRRQIGPQTSSHLVSWLAKHKGFVVFVLVSIIVTVQILLVGPVILDLEPVKKFRAEGLPTITPPKWWKPASESPDSWFPSSAVTNKETVAATPASSSSDKLGDSLPAPLSEVGLTEAPQSQASLYKDTNPHRGELPAYLENLLNRDPIHQAPPPPPKAPTISPEVWSTRLWKGQSTTEASQADQPQKQPLEPEWRTAPYAGWKPPLDELSQPAKPVAKVQHDFQDPTRHSGRRNDAARDELIAHRQKMVRNAFIHAWEGYKKYAWGHDELRPVSKTAEDPFNGWGASIVDALDTLLVMGLPIEYDLARQHVRDIDFRLVGGTRSAYGSADGRIPVFETAIRYLGGLLSAYDLSGDVLMRDRAEELAQLIMPAFDTQTGVPNGRIRMIETPEYPNTRPQSQASVILSEAGSLLLEFTRLWQVTGNRTYFDRVQRTTDWLDRNMTGGRMESLFPTTIYPERNLAYGTISFGGMADSYYEYLIKEHQLLGGRLEQYGRMYSEAMEGARKLLISHVDTVPGFNLTTLGEISGSRYIAKLEHLACFSGGMFGLGSRLIKERADDLGLAKGVTGTCWWAYNSSTTGIGPESLVFFSNDDEDRFELVTLADGTTRRGKPRGSPIVGVRSSINNYLNRPETIESVLYMWRITGDPVWQERGWQMFASWVTHCMTDVGFSAIYDVSRTPATWADSMESFTFAETFKYYYLLFSPPELISLDEYVFTTEAHPLLLPKDGKWAKAGHGSKKFWDAEAGAEKHLPWHELHIYLGGEGGQVGGLTNSQRQMLWTQWQSKNSAHKIRDLIGGLGGEALRNKLRSLVERPDSPETLSAGLSQKEVAKEVAEEPKDQDRKDRLLASVGGTLVYEAADGTLEVEFAETTDAATQSEVLEQLEAAFDTMDADSAAMVLRSVEAIRKAEEEAEQQRREHAVHFARLRSKGIR